MRYKRKSYKKNYKRGRTKRRYYVQRGGVRI